MIAAIDYGSIVKKEFNSFIRALKNRVVLNFTINGTDLDYVTAYVYLFASQWRARYNTYDSLVGSVVLSKLDCKILGVEYSPVIDSELLDKMSDVFIKEISIEIKELIGK